MKLTIQTLNDQGKKALQQHMTERAKLSKFHPQRIMYNKLFEETVISEDPFMLQIKIKSLALAQNMKFKDLKAQIEEALKNNKACPEDYIIREVKE